MKSNDKMAPTPYINKLGDTLHVGGYTINALCDIAGRTPFYAYDSDIINKKIQVLKADFPEAIDFHYAIKANPYAPLVHYLSQRVQGLDVASHEELLLALSTGTEPEDISFAGPGKSDLELLAAIQAGIIINVESRSELSRIKNICQQKQRKAKVALRINPAFSLKSSGMKMGGGAQVFGIDAEAIDEILTQWCDDAVSLHGFHLFAGSQNLNASAIIQVHNATFEYFDDLLNRFHIPSLTHINIGGGFGIPYFPGDALLDTKAIGQNLQQLLKQYPRLAKQKLVIELGRFLVGECGFYICEVVDKKISRDTVFLVCNGGLHHHLALSGNFGQVIRKNYPVTIVPTTAAPTTTAPTTNANPSAMDTDASEIVNLSGPLCTPLDILGQKLLLPKAKPGDRVVVFQSGAYGYSASPQSFLSHPTPGQLFI